MGMYRTTKIGSTRITRSNRGVTASRSVKAGLTQVTMSTRGSGKGGEFIRTTSRNNNWVRIFNGKLSQFEETQPKKKLRSITV